VIRVSQWAEIRHLHLVDKVPKRAIARRLGIDRKTVDRALGRDAAPRRISPPRARRLDAFRVEIEGWLKEERRLTAKRVGTLLKERHPELVIRPRAVRRFVARVRDALFVPEAFVHRTHRPGHTLEVDFGETLLEVAGVLVRGHYVVATLPACNVHFAKVYPMERLECLLDGLLSAFLWFGGLTERAVLDNTSLAVREVLRGTERLENRTFHAFRGELALAAEFCAPAKGWEKGSVEGGVEYVRENCFRPLLKVASWGQANARILEILDADLDVRRLADGRTCREALAAERARLRPLPLHLPDACRIQPRVIDKFGHVGVDGVRYSVPIEHAYKAAIVRLFFDRLEIQVEGLAVASHPRSFRRGENVLDPRHVLRLLARKPRAAAEATALQGLPEAFHELRRALREATRRPDHEWVEVLRLLEIHTQEEVEAAVKRALERGSPRLATIRQLLRRSEPAAVPAEPVVLTRPDLKAVTVPPAQLSPYDTLTEAFA
jgi:transposase